MAKTVSNWKIFKSLDYSVQILLKQTIDYLSGKFNQSLQVFTAASPFGQILLVLENLSQMIFYYIEDSITELSMKEATRVSSIYSLSTLAGHSPSRAISANGEISLVTTSNAATADFDTIIIPNLSKIKSRNNGLNYIIKLPQDDIKFSMKGNNNGLSMKILQGNIETQTLVAIGQEMESFSLNSAQNYLVDNYLVDVYVNGEKWKRYDSILDMPRGKKGYIVKTGITTGVDIFFGNDFFGKVPAKGSEIKVEYLVNSGASGNIITDQTSQVLFDWSDTGFTLTGNEVDLNEFIKINTVHSPQFGANPEDSELTRLLAPKQSKSFALVNIDHYVSILRRLKLFSVIDIFLDENDSRMLNLFLIPDVTKLFNSGKDYFNIDSNSFKFSEFRKNELLRYLNMTGSKLISTDTKIVDPIIKKYVININTIVFDDVATEIIKKDIYNNLGNYFISNKRRKRIPKSDLIKILEEIAGIDSVSINIVSEDNEVSIIQDPNADLIGIDEFNDIIIKEYELPIIQGGFKDRYGNEYSQGISEQALGSVNIQIKKIVPRPLEN
tara:strand:- start:13218 stop:14879 length:1662 start_codon:yes stop_codon:yes gene_type:complete